MITRVIACALSIAAISASAQRSFTLKSPDKNIQVKFELDKSGVPTYSVKNENAVVLERSKLGLIRQDADFSKNLSFISASAVGKVTDSYELLTSKRRFSSYNASKQVYHLKNKEGKLIDLIFQVSNDGLAFRYYFPGKSIDIKKIQAEVTSFNFDKEAKGFLQPMSDAKTGWAKVHPSYEEFYEQGIPVGKISPTKAGWIFPALFQTKASWVLITETFPLGDYCATRLKAESPEGEYSIGFPQTPEVLPNGALNPESRLPWFTPWRIVTVGTLKTIVESTLGTDLAMASAPNFDKSYLKPGKASWSWVLLKDDSTVYNVQKRFIDFASQMNWEYCLIDADWDTKIGYEKIKELVDYGKEKNIGILLWYNSAGNWNETPQTPKNLMLTAEVRRKEFKRIQDMGVKGIKVDFFGGDGQSFMKYYVDILKDAADHQLLVNFHGCTLPRGLQRTYPNLVSAEAIKGEEFVTFDQKAANVQPNHCAMLPFTRNAFDPMDFTPMALYKIPNIKRKTTCAFELALPVLFLSGVQHLAEIPEGMRQMPDFVQNFLKTLPVNWDDVKFIDGFPGKYAVIARRSGNRWIVAGINGEDSQKNLMINLSAFQDFKGSLITDGDGELFKKTSFKAGSSSVVNLKPNGGFVIELVK